MTTAYQVAAMAALALVVAFVYSRVGSFGFVNFDDGGYVFENAVVRSGLTWDGARWAFTTLSLGNWHPLTWLSLMLDVSLLGVDPAWLHRANAVWHLANAGLVWWVLARLTSAPRRSLLVAMLFAVHPLHVESVAWISERKDLLYTFFWFVTIALWLGYVRRPSRSRYAAVLGAFSLSLMSKPMAVTLPLVLLLLDLWPLRRLAADSPQGRARLPRLVMEKVPLLVLSAASSLVTILAQDRAGATATADALPYAARFGNAALAIAWYLRKTFWPVNLAVFYPNPAADPEGLPPGQLALALVVLLGLTAIAVWQRVRRPFLLFGWAWFLVTLAPVIGVVQVGRQGMADRYTYVPLVGAFVALVWVAAEVWGERRALRPLLAAAAAGSLLALAVVARAQTSHWKDSFTLFHHAATVTEANWLAWKNLGVVYHERGETLLALDAFQRSVRAKPGEPDAWYNLGVEHAMLDQHAEAAECFRRSVVIEPADPDVWFALGISRAILGQHPEAEEALRRVEALAPARAAELAVAMQRIARQLAGRP